MKKLFTLFSMALLCYLLMNNSVTYGQLSGNIYIPSGSPSYATISAAITALNSSGVGTGGVTFLVAAGYTETLSSPTAGNITATGTASNQIIFQKDGSGANPIITAGVGTSTSDAIIKITGGDYITFDGIDIKESSANTTTTTRMEFGYYISNASATNGAQYNTIKNCKITLNRAQTTSVGIYQFTTTTSTSQINGNNNYNKYYNITVENSYTGIYLKATSSTYFDSGCEIGAIDGGTTTIGASTANDIGNGSTAVYGIRASYQRDVQIFNTIVRNVTCSSNSNRIAGIFLENSYGTSAIYNNKVGPISGSSTTASTTNYLVAGMRLDVATSSTVNVYNNFIFGITSGQTSATASAPSSVIQATGIALGVTVGTTNLFNNSIRIEGSTYINSACVTSTGGTANTMTFKNNIFSNHTATQTGTPKHYCIMRQGTSGTLTGLDNNDYYVANSGNGYVGFYTADVSSISDWRTAMSQDIYSVSENPPFTSATDLHLLTGTATLLESGGTPINTPEIDTDIDGNTRSATTPDIGADEGNFTAVSKTINWYTINQASTDVVYSNAVDKEILRIDLCVVGVTGTFSLNSLNVNSANTNDNDVSNVKLYRTSTSTFSTDNMLGLATNFSGGIASFSSINYDLPSLSMSYLWVVYDIAPDATEGNTLDARILTNQININGSTYPSADADPAGSRIIVSPMNGTYTIDASGSGSRNYTTFTSAVADVNFRGISESVIFNVAAGFTENTTAPLLITATGTFSNTITFQKDPVTPGTNPLITRTDAGSKTTTSLGGDGDAIIQINGSDFIIFDGIDVSANDAGIEYGYYTYKPSGTDGCKNVTIKNSSIAMTKSTANNVVTGIYISNGPTSVSSNTGVTVTDESGRNENIVVSGNTIQNVNDGIYVLGYNHPASPYNLYDQNVTIGSEGAGNTIQNFGWTTSTSGSVYGIYSAYCNNINVSYNNLNNTANGGVATTCWLYAIYASYTKAANITYSYNTLTLTTTGTRSSNAFGNNAGDANTTINMHHNTITDCVIGNSGGFNMFNNGVSSITLNIYSNTFINNTLNAGSLNMISTGTAGTVNVYNNSFTNNTVAGGTGTNTAISIGGGNANIYNNTISAFNATVAAMVYAIHITGGSAVSVYNNLIYNINSLYTNATTDAIRGISITSTTANSTIGLYYNTINLSASTGGTDFWTSCVYHTYNVSATTAALDMRNNILVNTSTPIGAGKTIAFRRSASTDLNNYSSLSNNNLFYAGTPDASRLIFYDGTNSDQTLAEYQTRVSPMDDNSVSGDPGFISNTNLQPDASNINSWNVKGGAYPIASVTTDFAGVTRRTSISEGPEDIGAYKFSTPTIPQNLNITGTIADGSTSIITFAGKTLATITWHSGSGTLPTSISAIFKPGVLPPGSLSGTYAYEYLEITETGGVLPYTYDLTMYYNMARTYNIDVADQSKMRVAKYSGGTWESLLLNTSTNTSDKSVTITNINNGFSVFTFTGSEAPLPVELKSFTSSVSKRNVKLSWTTSKEINNTGFEIQRTVKNSENWVNIGFIKGNGNTNNVSTYNYEDKALSSGKYNYRLKQIDANGNFHYFKLSNDVEIDVPMKFELSQNYPNPFNPNTKINFDVPKQGLVSLTVYDILGREVVKLVNEIKQAGYYTIEFNGSRYSSGVYFYRLESSGFSEVKKMLLIK